MTPARAALDELTRIFFGAFTNKQGAPKVEALRRLFVPQAVITKRSGAACEIMTVAQFIAPRQKLLAEGALTDFEEWETSAHTEIFGGIAQRFCSYQKTGLMAGQPFTGRGVKTIQFILLDGEWRISALAWEDEPVGPKGGAR
ncbi:MAG: putative acetyltransferase domain protein [Lacunisphaera sp.]|nr:putative acetyltransferase domain protein [Lacunisphaera sp.]